MYPHNTAQGIARGLRELQGRLDEEGVGLRVWPGGELTLASRGSPTVVGRREDVITYAFAGKWVLFDFWEEDAGEAWAKLEPVLSRLRGWGFELLCAHPERISAVHRELALVDRLARLGVKFQLNSWCLCEPRGSVVRELGERWLLEGRYWVIGMDIHRLEGMGARVEGVRRAEELVGAEVVELMTVWRARELSGASLRESGAALDP
jgi:tyrosine-protein phosphatase YwqE